MMDHRAATDGVKTGRMIVVVGPSGAGKDTLMSYAAKQLQHRTDVAFVRRVITREGDAGGEDHEAVCEADFARLAESGSFAVRWEAHGLHYGIPADTLQQIKQGKIVVANGSRTALSYFRSAFPEMLVINVTARPEVLAARLEARGRESRQDILRRLQRSTPALLEEYDVVTIDNSGTVEEAGAAMMETLSSCLPLPHPR